MTALVLSLVAHLARAQAPAAPAPPPAHLPERRRRGSCRYTADAWGDRLVGYDGERRVSWVERLDRPVVAADRLG